MTEQEINNLIDSKIGKTKMSQLPEATQTSGLYSIGYTGNQSVKYKANLLQGDPLTVRKTYQTEAEALADKNPIDATTSLPLTVGQFVSIVDDEEKNGIYRISSISGDGTMSLELQGKLGDLSEYAKEIDVQKSLDDKLDIPLNNIQYLKTEVGQNLANPDKFIIGRTIADLSTGRTGTHATRSLTGLIKVEEGKSYYCSENLALNYYDANENYINSVASGNPITIPVGVSYVNRVLTTAGKDTYYFQRSDLDYENEFTPYKIKIDRDSFDVAPIYNDDIDYAEISKEKLNIFEHGYNLADPDEYENKAFSNVSKNIIVDSTSSFMTGYIPITPETDYFRSVNGNTAFYDKRKVFIEGSTPTTAIVTSSQGAYYMRQTAPNSFKDEFIIQQGIVGKRFEEFINKIPKKYLDTHINYRELDSSKMNFFKSGKNLANPSKVIEGKTISNYNTGIIDTNPDRVIYNLINIEEGKTYVRSQANNIAYLDKYGAFVEGTNDNPHTVPIGKGIKYMQTTFVGEGISTAQVEEGEVSTAFEPFYEKIPSKYLDIDSSGGGGFETETLFENATVSGDSSAIDVEEHLSVTIIVEKNQRAVLQPKVSNDGVIWDNASVISLSTGEVYSRIHGEGKFSVDVTEYKFFKTKLDFAGYGLTFSAKAYLLNTYGQVQKQSIVGKPNLRPSILNPASERINTLNADFINGFNPNEYFAFYGAQLRRSVDGGQTFQMIHNFNTLTPKMISTIADGTILYSTNDGSLWKSAIGDFTSWSQVHQFETPGTASSMSFGFHTYENILVASEYGPNNGANNARRAYISEDYGSTWRKMYEGKHTADGGNWHIHDVHYDPYSDIVWLVNGDGYASANVLYSLDRGYTWLKMFEDGYCPTQLTGIAALPNCVIFTTDSRNVGVWRWDRLTNIDSDSKMVLEMAFPIQDLYPGKEPIATKIGVGYGTKPVAYFSFSFFPDNVFMPCKIWGTSNGYDFYELWEPEEQPKSSTSGCGVMGISDLSEDGKIIATYLSSDGLDSAYNMIKIDNPVWV